MISLQDLINPPTPSSIVSTQLDLMTLATLPTTSWASGSVPRTLIETDAATVYDVGVTISKIAAGGYLTLAPSLADSSGISPWLDLVAESEFSKIRKSAIVTQGMMLLTDAQGAGPFSISIAQLTVQSSNGLQYVNLTGGVLPKNGTLTLVFQAMVAGASYNLPANTSWSMLTPLPGVYISNPDSLWITQQGADVESDTSLVTRCQAAWPGLGGGATNEVYQAWALESTIAVTRVLVAENVPAGGSVTIYCAGVSGGASLADCASVAAYIDPRRPLCIGVFVLPAVSNPITLTGTVYVRAASLAAARSSFTTALTRYGRVLDLGGTVYQSALIDLIQQIPGVRNVAAFSPADIAQAQNQVAVFTDALTWVAV